MAKMVRILDVKGSCLYRVPFVISLSFIDDSGILLEIRRDGVGNVERTGG